MHPLNISAEMSTLFPILGSIPTLEFVLGKNSLLIGDGTYVYLA